jgi:hypothetical protein
VHALRSIPVRTLSSAAASDRVEARVEAVCQKGCRQVRRDIETLQRGEEIAEARGLSPDERVLLLAELEQIMAVYGDTCSID